MIAEKLYEGDKAPDFTVPGVWCEEFRLSSKVKESPILLYFFPTDYGLMCTYYAEILNEVFDDLEKTGAKMFGVTPNTVDEHIGWMKRIASRYDHISDTDQTVSTAYGMLVGPPDPDNMPMNTRGFVLIDREMTIRYIWRAEISAMIIDPDVLVATVRDSLGMQ